MDASSIELEKKQDKHEFYEYAPDEAQSAEDADWKKRQAKTVRKLDLYITPVLMMLMLISYLDRGNIGFAATQGMIKDIHLKGSELNVCLFRVCKFKAVDTNRYLDRCFGFLHLLHSCRGKSLDRRDQFPILIED